jgi:hypothetical protein
MASLVSGCLWFPSLRDSRDLIVHKGGEVIVFLHDNRLYFQVFEEWRAKIVIPEIMSGTDAVDFQLYAALFLGYLISYLEEFSQLLGRRLDPLPQMGMMEVKSFHEGLRVLRAWLIQAKNL